MTLFERPFQVIRELFREIIMLLGIGFTPMGMLIVGLVALLMFGKRLPDVMKSLGRSVTEFKKGINDTTSEDDPPAKS